MTWRIITFDQAYFGISHAKMRRRIMCNSALMHFRCQKHVKIDYQINFEKINWTQENLSAFSMHSVEPALLLNYCSRKEIVNERISQIRSKSLLHKLVVLFTFNYFWAIATQKHSCLSSKSSLTQLNVQKILKGLSVNRSILEVNECYHICRVFHVYTFKHSKSYTSSFQFLLLFIKFIPFFITYVDKFINNINIVNWKPHSRVSSSLWRENIFQQEKMSFVLTSWQFFDWWNESTKFSRNFEMLTCSNITALQWLQNVFLGFLKFH